MPRGREWGEYIDDRGAVFALRVDADYFADPDRCWASVDPETTPAFPRGRKPRQVRGIDDEGVIARAVVPRVTCPLWTGAQREFLFYGMDQLPHSATVFEHRMEWPQSRP